MDGRTDFISSHQIDGCLARVGAKACHGVVEAATHEGFFARTRACTWLLPAQS